MDESHVTVPQLRGGRRCIREELRERLRELRSENKLLEYQRLEQRTLYDLEMLEETGTCKGVENYSRIIQRRTSMGGSNNPVGRRISSTCRPSECSNS